ncbi:cytochrome P450 [Saccharopolyspora subtropica]|uniref:Cytochrome P450 n=1 Tax=Saccharopolyspora thermophila TaxID=89367 RepID=A0A917JV46_9PSEU|nr:cytochrome P450 [Saccharopolyspora subtropica]GGI87729.1 cytochrome P450 [Saccharopolyspora subtropica]
MTETHEVLTFPMARPTGCPLDPPEHYRAMRQSAPVARATLPDGSPTWLVSRYADVRAVLRDPRVSADLRAPGFPIISAAERALVDAGFHPGFIRTDPPEHGRLRQMVAHDFTIKRSSALRPDIQRLVDERIDAMLAGPRPADLVAELALPVPSTVICWLLGVPVDDIGSFNAWTRTIVDATTTPEETQAANTAILEYFDRLIAVKQREPGDDIVSRLVARHEAGELSRQDVLTTSMLLLVAGHETTANMISLGVLALLQHPEQAAALRDDPDLAPGAVEELLRYLSISEFATTRVAVRDLEVGGQVIRAGEGIVALTPSANRDAAVFADPDVLDIRRGSRQHVAFGFGPHQCVGQSLARTELRIVYPTLLRRIPTLRLAADPATLRYKRDEGIFGVHALPVTWD